MEWEKYLPYLISFLSLVLAGYTLYLNRTDAKKKKLTEDAADVEKAHLTEATTLRKDLREMLGDANDRIDRFEEMLKNANRRINELESTVNDLTYEKKILEREKAMLQQDIERREKLFEEENTKLRNRVTELENKVEELKTHRT